eukprot:6188044-Pleurochrysis_carterae.AAC.1
MLHADHQLSAPERALGHAARAATPIFLLQPSAPRPLSLCLALLCRLLLRLREFSFASFLRLFTPSSCLPPFCTAASTRDYVRAFAWRTQSCVRSTLVASVERLSSNFSSFFWCVATSSAERPPFVVGVLVRELEQRLLAGAA